MLGSTGSDGAKNRDESCGGAARIFARYGAVLPLLAAVAAGCATQDDGADNGGNGATSSGGMGHAGTSAAGNAGNNASGSGALAGSTGSSGSPSGGSATGGSATGGNATGGSDGGAVSGSGGLPAVSGNGGMGGASAGTGGTSGAAGKGGSSGSAGSGGKGGSGGSAGSGGMSGAGGKGGSGGSSGSAGSGGMSGAGGSGGSTTCNVVTDCQNDDNVHNVCDAGKCKARSCNATSCAYELTRIILGTPTATSARGQAFVTWDATNMNLDFQILDKTPEDDSDAAHGWDDDSVEIYLDLNNSKKAGYDADDFQIRIPRNAGNIDVQGAVDTAKIMVARTENANGYELKVTLPWAALNGAGSQLGKTVGFSLAINDDANGGDRETQVMLFGSDQNFNTTAGFGNLNL